MKDAKVEDATRLADHRTSTIRHVINTSLGRCGVAIEFGFSFNLPYGYEMYDWRGAHEFLRLIEGSKWLYFDGHDGAQIS